MYDCTADVIEHQENVRKFLRQIITELVERQIHHDDSKLREPEKSMYDKYTPMLKRLTYGSDEYKQCLKEMGVALQHHYENNRHHPEGWERGVADMSLIDIIEMLADWKAATLRHANGSIQNSLEINKDRFQISDQLSEILSNTIRELGW